MDASSLGPAVLAWLGTYALHSTLFLGATWALVRYCPVRTPRLRERIWRLALLGGLLTTTLQTSLRAEPFLGRWSLGPGEPTSVAAEAEPAPADPARVGSSALAPAVHRHQSIAPEGATPTDALRPLHLPLLAATPPAAVPATTPAPARIAWSELPGTLAHTEHAGSSVSWLGPLQQLVQSIWPWRKLALVAFYSASALALCGFGLAWLTLNRRLADRRPLDGPLRDELERLMRTAGVRGRVRLSVSPSTASPITLGLLRREICVPARALTDLTSGQKLMLLAHELAHAVRRDPAWFTLYALVERVLFFQPLNRIARRELLATAELLCDDQAVRWTGKRLELASCLTEVAHWIVDRRPKALPAAFMAGSTSRLYHRVERLLDDRRSPVPEGAQRWWTPTALTAVAIVALAMPGLSTPTPMDSAPAPEWSAPAATPQPATSAVAAPLKRTPHTPAAPRRVKATPIGSALGTQLFEILDLDMQLLEEETGALRDELAERELLERFAGTLDEIDHRMRTLRSRRNRLEALAARVLSATD